MAKLNIKAENENGVIKSASGNKLISISLNTKNKKIAELNLFQKNDEILITFVPLAVFQQRDNKNIFLNSKTIRWILPTKQNQQNIDQEKADLKRLIKQGKKQQGEKCPHCDIKLKYLMHDIDGTNLVETATCPECGYGTPALN